MTPYWCELAWLGGDTAVAGVSIEVDGDRIARVDRCPVAPAGAERLTGLTLPGLANAHSHAFHRGLRGRTHHGGGTFWTWRDHMYALAARLTPDTYLELATACFAEMVESGYTCVGEFHYLHHAPGGVRYADPNEMGGVIAAAAEAAGVRLTLLDACYLTGGFDRPADGVQLRFSDADVDGWAGRVSTLRDTSTVRVGAAVHSVRAVPAAAIAGVEAWSSTRGAPIHAHVSEQLAENAACIAATGATPTGLLAEHGALTDRFTAVHATHLTDGDMEVLGSGGAACCLCPTTERDLGDGIGPATALATAGIALALGSDSQAVIDPFEEARAMELDARLLSMHRGMFAPGELAVAASSAGYRSLGWPDGGAIDVGLLADFVTVGLDGSRLAGTVGDDALAAVLFSASGSDVRDVVVGGRRVVRDGRHVRIDVGRALAGAIDAAWSAPVPG
jgi:formiminoglutamate deiminase